MKIKEWVSSLYSKLYWWWRYDSIFMYWYWCVRDLIRWYRQPNKHKLMIQNWWYNGFFGGLKAGYAPFLGEFIKWTPDPGIALIKCSDGEERHIPSYAIRSALPPEPNYTKMKKKGKMWFFGFASGSKGG